MKFYRVQAPDGRVVDVPQDELQEALDNGGKPEAGVSLPVKAPDGNIVQMPSEDIWEALENKGNVATYKETLDAEVDKMPWYQQGFLGAFTAAEQLASVGTFGLSDVALEAVNPQYQEEKAERAEAFPISKTIGQIGGVLAPTGIGSKAASGVVQTIKKGAGEAAIAGARIRGSEAPVEDKLSEMLDYKEIVSDMAWGGGLSGIFSALSKGVSTIKKPIKAAEKEFKKKKGFLNLYNTFKQMPEDDLQHISEAMMNSVMKTAVKNEKFIYKFVKNSVKAATPVGIVGGGFVGGPWGALAAYAGKESIESLAKWSATTFSKNTGVQETLFHGLTMAAKGVETFLRGKVTALEASRAVIPSLTGLRHNDPTDENLQKFKQYVVAAENPSKIVDRIRKGEVKQEWIETLETLVPEKWALEKADIINELSTKKDITESEKLVLSYLTGIPYNLFHSQYAQALYGEQQALQNAAQQPGPKRQSKVLTGKADKVETNQTQADNTAFRRSYR